MNSVVFASIYRFSLIFIFDINDIAWTLADAQTWCVVETSAGVISACLPTMAPLVKFFAKGLVSTTRSLSRSNWTRSGTGVLSRRDADMAGSTSTENRTVTAGDAPRRSNESYGLVEMSPNHRGNSHMKGKGWIVMNADADSDST